MWIHQETVTPNQHKSYHQQKKNSACSFGLVHRKENLKIVFTRPKKQIIFLA